MSLTLLERQFRRIAQLQHASAIMQWDEAVMMPPAAGEARASAMATLGVIVHEHLIAPQLRDWLAAAEVDRASGKLDQNQAANLREMQRAVRRASALPSDLVEACSRAQLRCEQAWRVQRAQNDWAGFMPLLREVVQHKREAAAAWAQALGVSPYDALLDEYEPFFSSAEVDALFARLRAFLPPLIEAVLAKQLREAECVTPLGPFPKALQEQLGRRLMTAVGFDMQRGRLDVSHHPFCGGVATDVRITTRYDETDFTSGIMGVLHETGHAKYEQGRPRAWLDLPIGEARGMSMHEGQSLLQEMQISRSREFLSFAAPHIVQTFALAAAAQPAAFSVDNLVRLFTRVARSKIRVNADEVTYPCHVILRYDIERALIADKLDVADIPEAWDAGMYALLGIHTGADYRDGCMQDVHWAAGGFGYFPTYTLGAMTAAQLFAAAERAMPSLRTDIAHGSFDGINDFLRRNIWSLGSLLPTSELLRSATGDALNPSYFEAHLRRRYLDA